MNVCAQQLFLTLMACTNWSFSILSHSRSINGEGRIERVAFICEYFTAMNLPWHTRHLIHSGRACYQLESSRLSLLAFSRLPIIFAGAGEMQSNLRWHWQHGLLCVIAGSWDDIEEEEEYHGIKMLYGMIWRSPSGWSHLSHRCFFRCGQEYEIWWRPSYKLDFFAFVDVVMSSLKQLVKEAHPSSVYYWGSSSMKYICQTSSKSQKSFYYVSLDQYSESRSRAYPT